MSSLVKTFILSFLVFEVDIFLNLWLQHNFFYINFSLIFLLFLIYLKQKNQIKNIDSFYFLLFIGLFQDIVSKTYVLFIFTYLGYYLLVVFLIKRFLFKVNIFIFAGIAFLSLFIYYVFYDLFLFIFNFLFSLDKNYFYFSLFEVNFLVKNSIANLLLFLLLNTILLLRKRKHEIFY